MCGEPVHVAEARVIANGGAQPIVEYRNETFK
jgi:hypothetical protein